MASQLGLDQDVESVQANSVLQQQNGCLGGRRGGMNAVALGYLSRRGLWWDGGSHAALAERKLDFF